MPSSLRLLQFATGLLAAVPVITGILAMTGISDPLYKNLGMPHDATLDSNLRFYGGVWLGLGLAAFWIIPRIQTQTVLFTALWGMIFLGGVGRLISMLLVGQPFLPFIGFTALEIIGAPIFIWWQRQLAQN